MSGPQEFLIDFPDAPVADANRYCEDLRDQLLDADDSIHVDRVRPDSSTMDFGATLAIVLGAPATIALAKALIAWTQRNNRANLRVVTKDGVMVAENLESKDAADVVRALAGK
jgi:hypothetical protein